MSQSKSKLIVVIFIFAILAMSSLACGGSSDVAAAAPEPTPDPVQAKHAAMENAYGLGETLFFYDASQGETEYALFYGSERIIFLKEGNLRGVKLTTQESINLTVKAADKGTCDWYIVHSFGAMYPGDYARYDGSWRVTHYTP